MEKRIKENHSNNIDKNNRTYLNYLGDLDNKEAIRAIYNHLHIDKLRVAKNY